MKVLFAAREGFRSRYIARYLAERNLLSAVLWETGWPAKQRKLRRHFLRTSPLKWPLRFLDLVALGQMSARVDRYVEENLPSGSGSRSLEIPEFLCADVNDRHALAAIEQVRPELVLIYGTSLLKKTTLQLCPIFLNIHGGLVPKYRNVHSEFWALYTGHPEEVGSSILKVTPGIDDGPVLMSRSVETKPRTLAEAHLKNLELGARLAAEVLEAQKSGQLSLAQSPPSAPIRFQTPSRAEIKLFKQKTPIS